MNTAAIARAHASLKQGRSIARVRGFAGTAGHALLPILLPIALLAIWQTGAAQGWISPQVLPSPTDVWLTLHDLAVSGDLWLNVAASLSRVLVGFAIGALLGIMLGAAMGASRTIEAYVLPTFNALVQIPVLAWLPFVLLLVG
uniref:ABC transporter permease n=1 Tax=Agrobacterium tumefaciens TaxID=358 RepID=UPI003B9DD6CE